MFSVVLIIGIGICLLRLRTVLGEFQTFDPSEEGNVDLVRNLDHEAGLLSSIIGVCIAFLSGQFVNPYPAAVLGICGGVIIWMMTIYWGDRRTRFYPRFFLGAAGLQTVLISLFPWTAAEPTKGFITLALVTNMILVAGSYELLSRRFRL